MLGLRHALASALAACRTSTACFGRQRVSFTHRFTQNSRTSHARIRQRLPMFLSIMLKA
jgi:hypothetical protein